MNGECDMFHADTLYDNEENFGLPEIEERDLSASLTLRSVSYTHLTLPTICSV